ncbi:uncharacterized protein SPSK_08158 [Sporothrix schenckii 1099-18]|uniref:Uncharacterized protein n=1 Tax=Sporothrix schenckii 1099-18 TaxID=1397361 RepID=A0A0F2MFS2_SPOSC|nr:uncharacterized protein SPSK_08158 [Sporothrix schenckii 1099-18]KJR88462.1 hypothetical protein SPSK_08158 [Sporothrix schenckii 1099-18]
MSACEATIANAGTHPCLESMLKRTVVAAHKRVAVCPPLHAVDVFLRLLQRNVHVAVHRLQLALVHHPRVQLHHHSAANDLAQERAGILALRLAATRAVLHGDRSGYI